MRQPWPTSAVGLEAIMSVMAAGFPPNFGERWSQSQLVDLLSSNAGSWLAGTSDGSPTGAAGFALTRVVADTAELMLLSVAPLWRRHGHARALVTGVSTAAQRHGATQIFAEVREGNDAVSFYETLNFVVAGRRRHYYRDATGRSYDALTMRRDLKDLAGD